MPTRNIVPRANGEGGIGTAAKHWGNGYFDNVNLNGGDLGSYLAESTGYGIVSGCTPSISGLTVTVAAGVVHLADGTRKELSATNITLDSADQSNPRIDLVYIDSTGTVAKVTGTAASPSAPALPSNGISVAQVNVAANASVGTIIDKRQMNVMGNVRFLFPKTYIAQGWSHNGSYGDCEIIITPNQKVLMIDSGNIYQYDYLISYLQRNHIDKVDYFLLTHYHGDHYGNIQNFLNQSAVNFDETKWYLPYITSASAHDSYDQVTTVQGWLTGRDVTLLTTDTTIQIDDNVSMYLFNCTNEAREYYAVNAYNWNDYSVQAIIYHGNVKAYYTADLWFSGIDYVYTNYDLPNVDLMKLNHHGWMAVDIENGTYGKQNLLGYMNELNPKKSVYSSIFTSDDNIRNTNFYKAAIVPYAQDYGDTYCLYDDAEFVSNGKELIKVSDNKHIVHSVTNCEKHIYIDCNYDYANGVPDGTINKPFTCINEARYFMGGEGKIICLHFAAGQYTMDIFNCSNAIEIYNETNTIFSKILLRNVNVWFKNKVKSNDMGFKNSNVIFDNGVEYEYNDWNSWSNSRICIYGDMSIHAASGYSRENEIIILSGSYLSTGTMTVTNVKGLFNIQRSFLTIDTLTLSNIERFVFSGGGTGYLKIGEFNIGANVAKIGSNYSMSRLLWNSSECSGPTSDRPNTLLCYPGMTYFDETLGKPIWYINNNWVDSTGTTV
jgi:hypothetical protein